MRSEIWQSLYFVGGRHDDRGNRGNDRIRRWPLGSAIGVIASARLTNYRIGQLEEKVNKHNNLIDRVYRLEKTAELEGERIKVANHRIDDLEDLNK